MKEKWSWRCCRKMKKWGNERRRGYGEDFSLPINHCLQCEPSLFPHLSLLTPLCHVAFSCFSPIGSWRMSCWRWHGKVAVGPRTWGNDSAPAAWRPWAWSSTAEISAKIASCGSATRAAQRLPKDATGDVMSVPRSRKCWCHRGTEKLSLERGKDSRWLGLEA